jgi:hypothetical protein
MPTTLASLSSAYLDRAAAFPKKLADNPVRALTLEPLRRRNAMLDAVFYDIQVISPGEAEGLSSWLAREGAILTVPPTGKGDLRVYPNKEEFFAAKNREVAALTVAGVGSSALGSAAFARNIADALEEQVAAVVSGYGLADVLTEAFGGFFLFGALNSVRHAFEPLDNFSKTLSRTGRSIETVDGVARLSEDTATVIGLLEDSRFSAKLIVGHSKGNLVISEALYAVQARNAAVASELARRLSIVTISAKIGMPAIFPTIIDVMGQWDGFGALNSRPDIAADLTVPRAWHSTNREFPFDMGIDVTHTLKTILPKLMERLPPRRQVQPPSAFDLPQLATAAAVAAAERRAIPAAGTPRARSRNQRRR